jgi:hypothetical protein
MRAIAACLISSTVIADALVEHPPRCRVLVAGTTRRRVTSTASHSSGVPKTGDVCGQRDLEVEVADVHALGRICGSAKLPARTVRVARGHHDRCEARGEFPQRDRSTASKAEPANVGPASCGTQCALRDLHTRAGQGPRCFDLDCVEDGGSCRSRTERPKNPREMRDQLRPSW